MKPGIIGMTVDLTWEKNSEVKNLNLQIQMVCFVMCPVMKRGHHLGMAFPFS